MTGPLQPQPMTPEAIADLVARTQIACMQPKMRGPTEARKRSEEAARWASDNLETPIVAAERFGRSRAAVRRAWHRLYPGRPVFRWRRR